MRQVEHHEHRPAAHHGHRIELALVRLDDPLNVGQAFRIGVSLGVRYLHLLDGTPAPPNAKLNRTARGAQHRLPFLEVSTVDALAGFRQNRLFTLAIEYATHSRGIVTVAAEVDAAISAGDYAGVVLLFGNEAHGMTPDVLQRCDAVAHLPLYGSVSSYNVATAIAMATWELVRTSSKT